MEKERKTDGPEDVVGLTQKILENRKANTIF